MTLPHHSLVAWQRADDLFISLLVLSRNFSGIRTIRADVAVTSFGLQGACRIVEGFGRHTVPDRLHFLQIASSSQSEAGYCHDAARRRGYISVTQ